MLLFMRHPETRLIDAGRVPCPVEGRDVELDRCLQCGWARDIRPDADTPFVRCQPPAKSLVLP
jgi:hypothetical protein